MLTKISLWAFCLLLLASCNPPAPAVQEKFVFEDIEGKAGKHSDFAGHWVVLNYWADWCKPCRVEVPHFNQLAAKYPEKVMVFGINFDEEDNETQKKRAKEYPIHYRLLSRDIGPDLGLQMPPGLPATYLIDPAGQISEALLGLQTLEGLEKLMGLSN